jgi:hypothetical protein
VEVDNDRSAQGYPQASASPQVDHGINCPVAV